MYNQGNMRLHVDLFIKYVSNNVYSDNNLGQPQSILNIFLTFLVAYTLWQPFVAYFRSWYWYHCFFLLGGMKMSGSAGLFSKKSGRWETQKKIRPPLYQDMQSDPCAQIIADNIIYIFNIIYIYYICESVVGLGVLVLSMFIKTNITSTSRLGVT